MEDWLKTKKNIVFKMNRIENCNIHFHVCLIQLIIGYTKIGSLVFVMLKNVLEKMKGREALIIEVWAFSLDFKLCPNVVSNITTNY
jgi:hypothetical protein